MIEQERNTFRKLLIEHKAITDFDDENPHVTIYLDDLTDLVDEIRERNGKMWSELFMKANAMYSAAQYLSTDASQLHKAMEDYHQFVINNLETTTIKVYWPRQKDTKDGGLVSSNGRIKF